MELNGKLIEKTTTQAAAEFGPATMSASRGVSPLFVPEAPKPYAGWTAEQLLEGMVDVKRKIAVLEDEVEKIRERKREKAMTKLQADMDSVKEKLVALGGGVSDSSTKKRKRTTKKQGDAGKAGKGKRKKLRTINKDE